MARKLSKIRVGIIRCDTHALWYAPYFEKPDPQRYRDAHRGLHYYHYKWDDPEKMRLGTIPGMTISRVYDDEDRANAEKFSEIYCGRPKVCDSYEEVSDDVDLVYIADCSYEGKDHLRFATPGLRKGVPHFVDKPFAYTLKDAQAMVDLGKKHNTAVMCLSLLRESPYLDRFKIRLRDIAPVGSLFVACGGPGLNSVFHGLSMIQSIMGEGCQWVESMGPQPYYAMRLHYPGLAGGTEVILFTSRRAPPAAEFNAGTCNHCRHFASAYGAGGSIHSPGVGDYLFPYSGVRIVKMAKRMAQTKKPQIPYESMLELMEMIEAGRCAHNKGKRVYLEKFRKKAQPTRGMPVNSRGT